MKCVENWAVTRTVLEGLSSFQRQKMGAEGLWHEVQAIVDPQRPKPPRRRPARESEADALVAAITEIGGVWHEGHIELRDKLTVLRWLAHFADDVEIDALVDRKMRRRAGQAPGPELPPDDPGLGEDDAQ
jgi:hypothetical protein